MEITRRTSRLAPALVAGAAVLLSGCTPPTSDGGEVIVTTDARVTEVRAAREALAEPVPALLAESERLVEALADIWVTPASTQDRAARADALRLEPLRTAVGGLDAVELEGDGPDVVAARALTDAMVAEARSLTEVVAEEVATLTEVVPFDAQLEELLAGWDARGSYSEQLAAFEALAAEAEELAADAGGRTARPPCTGLWERRAAAATTVAKRTLELRVLIRDRRGQEFDELRDEFRQDPYGLGSLLGELDAAAAADCWAEESGAAAAVPQLQEHVDELAAALDPPDLQG